MQELSKAPVETMTMADAIIQAAQESGEQDGAAQEMAETKPATPMDVDQFVKEQLALADAADAKAAADKSRAAGNGVGPAKWTAFGGTNGNDASNTKTTYPAHKPWTPSGTPVAPLPRELPPCPDKVDQLLANILTWPRTHASKSEGAFGDWLVGQLNKMGRKPKVRAFGCLSAEVAHLDGTRSSTLFVAHVDTVDYHDKDGYIDADGKVLRKAVVYDPSFGLITLDKSNTVGNCLGADDGVGVWMMLRMIEAKVPGSYLFTRGEELGRLGAQAMVANSSDKEWLSSHLCSVEFDRPRNDEVITHQSGGTRCASDSFGKALADALTLSDNLAYETSKRGVYTDNYDFRGLIPENVNLGVGYSNQHGKGEELDYGHASALLTRCMTLSWDDLPIERTPVIEQYGYSGSSRRYSGPETNWQKGLYAGMDDDDDDDLYYGDFQRRALGISGGQPFGGMRSGNVSPLHKSGSTKKRGPGRPRKGDQNPDLLHEVMSYGGLDEWIQGCYEDPDMVARVVVELAVELAAQQAKYRTLNNQLKKRTTR